MDSPPLDKTFQLFSKPKKRKPISKQPLPNPSPPPEPKTLEKENPSNTQPNTTTSTSSSQFSTLGLSNWAIDTLSELGLTQPTPVQHHCIPKILTGHDVLGISQTGSGKTAAFALPILNRLAEDPYGVFCLVITPTRELAYQLAEQFRALGSGVRVRVEAVVGGMDMITQSKKLRDRPHVVVSTPGRISELLKNNDDIRPVFANTKFLVLDEADRVLDVDFEKELAVIFKSLPSNRQTLLFSATMTSNLQTLLEVSANKAYFYEAYEGLQTVESLQQQYLAVPEDVKDVYLLHILSKMEDMGVCSAMIFVNRCRTCHLLSLLLEELDQNVVALHAMKSQALRLNALHRFKSGQSPILLATDVASRGLDIPTVDLVINYDIPRCPSDYIHRVGRTARAGRGGLSVSLVTPRDVSLVHGIEAEISKQLEEFEYKEKEVLADITKVYKARRVATMKMLDDGFEDQEKERKKQKQKTLALNGLSKNSNKRKRQKPKT